MGDEGQDLLAFLGVAADRRLLGPDLVGLPDADQHREPAISTQEHQRLVVAGSLLTGVTLIGGAAATLYGGGQLLFNGGDGIDAVLAVIGILLVVTHWGWVHVAEYLGVTIDERRQRSADERSEEWLSTVEPYPRFSVSTGVLADAATRAVQFLHRPVMTPEGTFTFVREVVSEQTWDARTPAETIASSVETMRRQARLETDRFRELWDTAATAYAAALAGADDDRRELAAERAAATALSEHINASLLEPPLVE